MKELIRIRVQYASRQQCCKTHKRPFYGLRSHIKYSAVCHRVLDVDSGSGRLIYFNLFRYIGIKSPAVCKCRLINIIQRNRNTSHN